MSEPLITGEDLKSMSPEAISTALHEGRLDHLLARRTADPPSSVGADQGAQGTPHLITREDLKTMSPEAIVAARKAGRLNHLLAGRTGEPAPADADQGARGTPRSLHDWVRTMTPEQVVQCVRDTNLLEELVKERELGYR